MKILDVHEKYTHLYTLQKDNVQHAITHLWWSDIKKQLQAKRESTTLLMDESCFMWHHITVRLNQSHVLTRTQYKDILTQKITEVQEELWIKAEQLVYSIKNMRVNRKPVSYVIGESWTIVFDICCFALKTKWSDIVHLSHVSRYPRRYFLLSHPLLAKKRSMYVLAIQQDDTTLMLLENGRYKNISTLNGWDDLLWQAYEQSWLDPYSLKDKTFDAESIWSKLVSQAHTNFNDVLLGRVQTQISEWQDTMIISRLIDQPQFIHQLSEWYISKIRGRLIPYRASDMLESYWRKRSIDEIPVLLLLQKMKG